MQRFPLFKGMQQNQTKCLDQKASVLISKIACNRDWPTCFLDCSQSVAIHDFFTFTAEFTIIESYFYPEFDPNLRTDRTAFVAPTGENYDVSEQGSTAKRSFERIVPK